MACKAVTGKSDAGGKGQAPSLPRPLGLETWMKALPREKKLNVVRLRRKRKFLLSTKQKNPQILWNVQHRTSHWQSSLLGLRAALPMRAEPKKKKKVDMKMEQAFKERLRKKIRKLEKVPQELIPIEDFITPYSLLHPKRVRPEVPLSGEESERRALLLKKWALYKQNQHKAEMDTLKALMDAQAIALKELRLESEELYQAAILRDNGLFPFERQEPVYSAPLPSFEAPDGKCADVTRVYSQ